jgi:hypothetical protein
MKVLIEPVVENNYLIPFKITREQVNETVTHEDVKKSINFTEFTLILFRKKFDNYYVLVDGRWKPSLFSLLIFSAFKIDQPLIKNIPVDNPIAVLEQLANEFGADITVRDEKRKFIQGETLVVPIENPAHVNIQKIIKNNISVTDNGSTELRNHLGDILVKPELLGDRLQITIGLIYYINTVKYTEYLRSNNLI